MDQASSSLLDVTIDFDRSHLFFPTIVMWVLLFLLACIFLLYGLPFLRAVAAGERKIPLSPHHFDALRFFGTIVLTVVYFLSMDYIGRFFPNTGLGFLLMSIPFMFLLSLLYVHRPDWRKVLLIGINALVSPAIAWYLLANLFNISLP